MSVASRVESLIFPIQSIQCQPPEVTQVPEEVPEEAGGWLNWALSTMARTAVSPPVCRLN
jgi:hypothetical protein